jgi:hypothetical protein
VVLFIMYQLVKGVVLCDKSADAINLVPMLSEMCGGIYNVSIGEGCCVV